MISSVPLIAPPVPYMGYRVNIVGLPEKWLRLSDRAQWDEAVDKLLRRIGMVCQKHIRAIMRGMEPRRDGQYVYFQEATGRGVQSIQWEIINNGVEIFADPQMTGTKNGISYLVYQEFGVSTQPMKWLEGKTVPYVLVRGVRTNPATGTVVQGVTRVKFAGPGTRFAGGTRTGKVAATKKVAQEAVDQQVHYSTITSATFAQESRYNPTGYRWWHPGYPGKHFFRDGIVKGITDAADHMAGLVFRVAGGGPDPELGTDLTGPDTYYTQEYQRMLDEFEQIMREDGDFPYSENNPIIKI